MARAYKAIDLFAGWGGMTTGAHDAGLEVVYAANHWQLAVNAHAANHPGTLHECQDLRQADWTQVPAYDVLLAAPACQGHSTASQAKRRQYHDALRATAFAVIDCADVTRPSAILVENVPSFRRWCGHHVTRDGVKCQCHSPSLAQCESGPAKLCGCGEMYQWWKQGLSLLGYEITEHVVNATAHGVPQLRERLFVVGTRRPGFTYDAPKVDALPSFRPCIEVEGDHRWRSVAEAGPAVQKRIAAGIDRLGRDAFLTQHVTGHRGISLDEPIRTVTCQDQWALVDHGGYRYRPLTVRENARAMGFPDSYAWPVEATRGECIKGLGNAVCPPVARDLCTAIASHLG